MFFGAAVVFCQKSLNEPIAKLAYSSHPGESRGPEYLENTGYRLYEHEASLSTA
jgi:hypothetical protein